MSVLATVAVAAEGAHHELNPLWMPAPLFGVVILAIFVLLGAVTFSFRDVANRHSEKAEAYAREHGATESQHH